MAFPLPRGITPPEIAFLSEMEMVTIQPRQRLEGLDLLGVSRVPQTRDFQPSIDQKPRAQLNLSSHRAAPRSPSGSLSSSSANAAQTSSPRPGYTQSPLPSSSTSRPRTKTTRTPSPLPRGSQASLPCETAARSQPPNRALLSTGSGISPRRRSCRRMSPRSLCPRASHRLCRIIGSRLGRCCSIGRVMILWIPIRFGGY